MSPDINVPNKVYTICAKRYYDYSINYLDSITHWTRWTWFEGIQVRFAVAVQVRRAKNK